MHGKDRNSRKGVHVIRLTIGSLVHYCPVIIHPSISSLGRKNGRRVGRFSLNVLLRFCPLRGRTMS